MRIYNEHAEWWPLLSAPDDYADEAEHYWRVLTTHARRSVQHVLELGCGGGNNAVHLKRRAALTLTDLSPAMLAVSRRLNPACEHVAGDMRSLRLRDAAGQPRAFDAVFVHDAIMSLTQEADLRRAMETAYFHCAPGGVALFVVDCTRETWSAGVDHGGRDGEGRGLRYFEWVHDPDPDDTEYAVDMVYLMRSAGGAVHVEHERHRFGLFAEATWRRLLAQAGFTARVEPCAFAGGDAARYVVGTRD